MRVTCSDCQCVYFTFGARAWAHVRLLENFTDEQRPSRLLFFFFFTQHKGNEGDNSKHTLSNTHNCTQRQHPLHSSLTVREVISQSNTCYLTLAHSWIHAHPHIHCNHMGKRSLSHTNTLAFVFRQRLASAALS